MYKEKEIKENKSLFEIMGDTVILGGLVAGAAATFMQFVPIYDDNWYSFGAGKFVFYSCIVCIVLSIIKKYFYTFFLILFNMFFVLNEAIIKYDEKAVELGQEIATESNPGFFRSMIDIYFDIFKHGCGATTALLGLSSAFAFTLFCWVYKVHSENLEARPLNDKKEEAKLVKESY